MDPHTPTHAKGKIILLTGAPLSGSIQDISDKGATLRVSSTFGIPETFDMVCLPEAITYHCRVIRKAPTTLEVSFE